MKAILEGLIKQAISMFLTEAVVEKAKDMLIAQLEELALKSDNSIDDKIVEILKDALK